MNKMDKAHAKRIRRAARKGASNYAKGNAGPGTERRNWWASLLERRATVKARAAAQAQLAHDKLNKVKREQ